MSDLLNSAPLRLVETQNRGGSRQHFYHFFFGCLFPLARYLAATHEEELPLVMRSCGPHDMILHELELPRLMLAEKQAFQNLVNSLPRDVARKVGLIGFDIGWRTQTYDKDGVLTARKWLLERLAPSIAAHRERLAAEWTEQPRVAIIDRGMPQPFYSSWLSERPAHGVGAQRRRVSNHDAMVAEIARQYPGTRSVLLEGRTLGEQIALFQLADVVVAQHGASLANMVWMHSAAGVIEFTGGEPMHIAFFRKLSATLGTPHLSFPQEGRFGAIDPEPLARHIADVLVHRVQPAAPPPPGNASVWHMGTWTGWTGRAR